MQRGPAPRRRFLRRARSQRRSAAGIHRRAAADLADLMDGLLEANDRMRDDGIDAVLQAAATAFGFVYVHPFQDGNGRLHRCLIHHVLAERKFTPPGMVFPVSSVMLDRIDDYRTTLQASLRPADAVHRVAADAGPQRRGAERDRRPVPLLRLHAGGGVPVRVRQRTVEERPAARDRLSAPS